MTQSLFLGAYWPSRRESLQSCAGRLRAFLVGMTSISPHMATWYQRGRSRKDAHTKRVDPEDSSELLTLLGKGRHSADVGSSVFEDLGFGVGMWNGADQTDHAIGINILCGAFNDQVLNCVTMNFPTDTSFPFSGEAASNLLSLVANTWQPEWAGIMSEEAKLARKFSAHRPFVDWMLYVTKKIESLPAPAEAIPLASGGTIIVVQPNPPLADDRVAFSRIEKIDKLIRT